MRMDMVAALGISAVVGLITVTGARAGDVSCIAGDCYELARRPDIVTVVERPVVIRPAVTEVVHYPAAVIDNVRRVEVLPGSFNVQQQPAIYGSFTRTVMVSPARTVHAHIGPSHRRVVENVVVRPARVRWEFQRDARGRLIKCRVVVPAVTRRVTRTVVVADRTVAHVVPARFAQVQQPMLISPARRTFTYNPPVYQYVREPMMVRPPVSEVIRRPAVIGFERQAVIVRPGGQGWQPIGYHGRW